MSQPPVLVVAYGCLWRIHLPTRPNCNAFRPPCTCYVAVHKGRHHRERDQERKRRHRLLVGVFGVVRRFAPEGYYGKYTCISQLLSFAKLRTLYDQPPSPVRAQTSTLPHSSTLSAGHAAGNGADSLFGRELEIAIAGAAVVAAMVV